MKLAIDAQALEQRYGYRRALEGVHLEVPTGACLLVLGQNGAGKSTLLKVLATLVRPSAGEVRVMGHSLPREAADLRRSIGYLGHEPQIYPGLTALENLEFGAKLHGLRPARSALLGRLEEVGLGPVAMQAARSYSRGMLQRLALVRALLHDPELVLLDEPFTGLDAPGRSYVLRLLERLRASGKTVALTTHQLEEVYPLASQVLVLARGVVTLAKDCAGTTLDAIREVLR